MSWKGLTKAVARMPHQIGKATGYASETKDEDFEVLEEAFKRLEAFVKSLYDDSRKFKDSLLLMLSHQAALSKTFLEAYEPIAEGAETPSVATDNYAEHIHTARQYSDLTEQLKENLSADLDMIERLVIAPCGDLQTILQQVKRVLVKRSHKLVDYDRFREAVKKLKDRKDRTVSDEKKLGQLENQLDQASREFFNVDNQLKQDLPALLHLRVDFINPCLFTFYTYQLRVYQTLYGSSYEMSAGKFDNYRFVIDDYHSKGLLLEEILSHLTIPKRFGKNARPSTSPENRNSSPSSEPPTVDMSRLSVKQATPPLASPVSNASATTSPPLRTVPVPRPPAAQYVIALYDFDAQAEGDLSFKRGDRIEVVQKTPDVNDWWTGRLNGQQGVFPGK